MTGDPYLDGDNMERKVSSWLSALGKRKTARLDVNRESTALLVLDMQRFFLDRESHAFLPSARSLLPNINELIGGMRKIGVPVYYTVHAQSSKEDDGMMGRWWNDVVRPGPWSQLCSALDHQDEMIIQKPRYSAFHSTGLLEELGGEGVESVVVCGVMTHVCCLSTVTDAFIHDLRPFLVMDGTASVTENLHLSALRIIDHAYGEVLTCQEIMSRLQ